MFLLLIFLTVLVCFYRSSSKKTLTDLTDSGVSVVSDTPPVALPTPAGGAKESRVLTWLMESDRRAAQGGCSSHTHSELSAGKHRSTRQPTSPNASRYVEIFISIPQTELRLTKYFVLVGIVHNKRFCLNN